MSAATIPGLTGVTTALISVQSTVDMARILPVADAPQHSARKLERFFMKVSNGSFNANAQVMTGLSYATGTLLIQAPVASATYSVAGLTFTGRTAPTLATEFLVSTTGQSNATVAVSLANAINAYAPAAQVVGATNFGSTLQVYSIVPGMIGNQITQSLGAPTNWGQLSGATFQGASQMTVGNISMGL